MYDGIQYRGHGQEVVETLASMPAFRYGTA
jgi:ornithine carbamoyltransferase